MIIDSQDLIGIVLLNKPLNISSNQAVQKIKRMFKVKKAGHTGSLDLLATGMLPVCINQATKFSSFFLNADKKYRVTASLGYESTTGDEEGEKIKIADPSHINIEQIDEILSSFLGEQEQIPPMYSALKHQGKRLYKLARQGVTVLREKRKFTVYDINILEFDRNEIKLNIVCSKGTYVRTLVEDLGKKLGCGAYVKSLARYGVANLTQMVSFEELELMQNNNFEALRDSVFPLEEALSFLPSLNITEEQYHLLKNGRIIARTVSVNIIPGFYRIFLEGLIFLGVVWLENDTIFPRQLL